VGYGALMHEPRGTVVADGEVAAAGGVGKGEGPHGRRALLVEAL